MHRALVVDPHETPRAEGSSATARSVLAVDEMLSETPNIPVWGGALTVNCLGVAGCWKCGWRGIPPQVRLKREGAVDERLSTYCPSCERESLDAAIRRLAVPERPAGAPPLPPRKQRAKTKNKRRKR